MQKEKILCQPARLTDGSDLHIARLVRLINAVYDEAESGLWQPGIKRTNEIEIKHLLQTESLIVATSENEVVGSVHVSLAENNVGKFGMLVADPRRRGLGIGSALVKAAEDWARDQNCQAMRLELLTPRSWQHPSKEFLKTWYARMGYIPQRTEPFDKALNLATPCEFTIWQKKL